MYLISREEKKFIRPLSREEIKVAGKLHQHQYLNPLRSIIASRLLNEMKMQELLLVCNCRPDGLARLTVSRRRSGLHLINTVRGEAHEQGCPLEKYPDVAHNRRYNGKNGTAEPTDVH
ncbi:hypothetical protein [Klebsiella aerogenes]|uniref:Uncharacterized protein n=1 Tax=Klebsiella aerogenes TaxID=548 RepID=A0AAP9R2G3_KLEAE|nr:hypothetical protein [Klebsiella aerogenes]QMR43133.1 hypothetical protein HV331_27060 [Klebsiella aerogenes]